MLDPPRVDRKLPYFQPAPKKTWPPFSTWFPATCLLYFLTLLLTRDPYPLFHSVFLPIPFYSIKKFSYFLPTTSYFLIVPFLFPLTVISKHPPLSGFSLVFILSPTILALWTQVLVLFPLTPIQKFSLELLFVDLRFIAVLPRCFPFLQPFCQVFRSYH